LSILYLPGYEDTLFYRFGFDVKILDIAGTKKNFFQERLTTDQLEDLLSDPVINIIDFNEMFPCKVSSKAKEKTLIFRYSNWNIKHHEINTNNVVDAIDLNDIIQVNMNNYHVSKSYFIDQLFICREHRNNPLNFDSASGLFLFLSG
jgi:hypothetical protein